MLILPTDLNQRLQYIFSLAWSIVLQQIAEGRLRPSNEASLQLHLGYVIQNLGTLALLYPDEFFQLELEKPAPHGRGRLDMTFQLNQTQAAVELKYFRKATTSTNQRAADLDMYEAWKDISRLQALDEYALKIFLCLTDDDRYPNNKFGGNAKEVSIAHQQKYEQGSEIVPPWKGKWKDKSFDKNIPILQTTECLWATHKEWSYLLLMFDRNGQIADSLCVGNTIAKNEKAGTKLDNGLTLPQKTIEAVHFYYSPGKNLSRTEIIDAVCEKFPDTNRGSIIPSDYCDNLTNKGISRCNPIFHYIKRNTYKVLDRPLPNTD